MNLPQTENEDQTGSQTSIENNTDKEIDQIVSTNEKQNLTTTDNGEQTVVSSDITTLNEEKDSTDETDDQENGEIGGKLPKTATNYPTKVLFGIGLIILGMGIVRISQIHKQQ